MPRIYFYYFFLFLFFLFLLFFLFSLLCSYSSQISFLSPYVILPFLFSKSLSPPLNRARGRSARRDRGRSTRRDRGRSARGDRRRSTRWDRDHGASGPHGRVRWLSWDVSTTPRCKDPNPKIPPTLASPEPSTNVNFSKKKISLMVMMLVGLFGGRENQEMERNFWVFCFVLYLLTRCKIWWVFAFGLEDWWVCLIAKKIKKWKEISGFFVSCCISLGAKFDGFLLLDWKIGMLLFSCS